MSAVVVDGVVTSSGILTPQWHNGQCNAGAGIVGRDPGGAADGRRARTVTIDGFGDYRVVASTLPDGSVLINGLPLASVKAILVQLGIIMGIVTGIALLAGGFVVFWIVRRSLRPLDRVVATARQVSDPAAGSRARSTSVCGSPTGTPTPAPRSVRSVPR